MLPLLLLLSLVGSSQTRYDTWVKEDVKYIISAQERSHFLKLGSDEERERFIQNFWRERDPDPSTAVNEYKEEHYRRIRYANEHFGGEGKQGWRTIRGQVYITHGPPDDIRYSFGDIQKIQVFQPTRILNPSGEALPIIYVQFPTPESETWIYRYIPGATSARTFFTIIFAKMDAGQIFTLQRFTKLVGITGAGAANSVGSSLQRRRLRDLTIKEFLTKLSYFRQDYRIIYAGSPRFYDLEEVLKAAFNPRGGTQLDQFSVQEATADLLRSPGDLLEIQKAKRRRMEALVESHIYYDTLGIQVGYGFLRRDDGHVSVPVHARIELPRQGKPLRELEIVGELYHKKSGQVLARFQDTLRPNLDSRKSAISYQTRLSVPPGAYQMRLIASDLENQRVGLWQEDVAVPNLGGKGFGAGELILCNDVLSLSELDSRKKPQKRWLQSTLKKPLALDDYVFVPSVDRRFRRGQNLTTLLEVYHPTVVSHEPQVEVQAALKRGGNPVYLSFPKRLSYTTGPKGDLIIYAFSLPLERLDLGDYDFLVRIRDMPSGQVVERSARIQIW